VKGFSEHRSEIVQAYFLDVAKGNDQVTPIIERACAAVAKHGKTPAQRAARQIEPPRDLLEDLDEVLGDEPVPAADIPALLARLVPQWMPYKRMTGKSLRAELADLGIKVPSSRSARNPASDVQHPSRFIDLRIRRQLSCQT
jgi:DNA segregation ATPase FtsK/SpoIIIE, S-DNA-T family